LPADVPDRGAALGPAPYAICSSENFERFIGPFLSGWTVEGATLLQFWAVVVFGGDVTPAEDARACLENRGTHGRRLDHDAPLSGKRGGRPELASTRADVNDRHQKELVTVVRGEKADTP